MLRNIEVTRFAAGRKIALRELCHQLLVERSRADA